MAALGPENLVERLRRSVGKEDIEDLKDVVRLLPAMRDYINRTPRYDPDRRFVLGCCCEVMEFLHGCVGFDTLGFINEVVGLNEEWVRSIPEGNMPEHTEALINLSHVLEKRYKQKGNPIPLDDLDAAIDVSQKAVTLSLNQHPDNWEWMRLAELLRKRSVQTSSIGDICRAIRTIEKAIETPPQDEGNLGWCFDCYGKALQRKYDLTKSPSDLAAAVDAHEKAVGYTCENDSNRGGRLSNLGNALVRHSHRIQSEAELNRAISVSQEAVESTPASHSELSVRHNNLSIALFSRFELTGLLADLIMCVDLNRRAVIIARAEEGHQDLAECLLVFGDNLQHLSKRMGLMEELEEAIKVLREAAPLLPNQDPKRARCLSSLGSALVARFDRLDQMDDLDEGIEQLKEAVKSTPDNNPNQPFYLTKLGNALSTRFRVGSSMDDLNACVEAQEAAVRKTVDDHPSHAICLINHGEALTLRFQVTQLIEDLDSAIKTHEKALGITLQNHPNIAVYEHNLGSSLAMRFDHSRTPEDMEAAIKHHERAFEISSAPPSLRISAARDAARLRLRRSLNESDDVKRASRLLKDAVELLPMTSPLSLKRSDQQDALLGFAGLASNAAALILRSEGTAFEALQVLELGRGVMASLQLDTQADITSLNRVDPQLAAQFQDLRNQLDSPQSDEVTSFSSGSVHRSAFTVSHRHKVLENFNDIILRIREGLPNFLMGPTEDELTTLANDGPIVVFNIDKNRSDVFIVTLDGIKTLPLPNLRYEEVKTRAKQSRRVIDGRTTVMRKGRVVGAAEELDTMDNILKWLWDVAVCPILTELERSDVLSNVSKDGCLPRLWWVTSGWLSLLPIHAAGYHADGSTKNALDRVVSSYAPTIKSLRFARDKVLRTSDEPCERALLVSMQETEEQTCLPGAEMEVDSLYGVLPASIRRTVLRKAAKDAIMPILRDCHICHFACHGESHPADPSCSKLLLADWKSNPLSVNDIVGLRPKHAKLAYLSLCSAADSQVEALLDESIHLMSAFLLAGFPSVVGTLWQIRDRLSVEVATQFYRSICENPRGIDVKESAAALNTAIRQIRNQHQFEFDSSCVWAPYIHIGV